MTEILTLAIPNKGRLKEHTFSLLGHAGLKIPEYGRRLVIDLEGENFKILFVRTKDIPEYVEMGSADLGITGQDLVKEEGAEVKEVLRLGFGKCKLVVAVPKDSQITSIEDIPDKSRVATAFPHLTREFFEKQHIEINVIRISGATEVTPNIQVADLITEITETGSTLRQNQLKSIGTILKSEAVLIANQESFCEKETEIDQLKSSIKSVLDAAKKRYVMANVKKENLEKVKKVLPGISGPTVMEVIKDEQDGMVAVHAVIGVDEVNETIIKLRDLKATGILILPIERMVK